MLSSVYLGKFKRSKILPFREKNRLLISEWWVPVKSREPFHLGARTGESRLGTWGWASSLRLCCVKTLCTLPRSHSNLRLQVATGEYCIKRGNRRKYAVTIHYHL
jgi:hypothetical protein